MTITVLPLVHRRSRITWDDPDDESLAEQCAAALGGTDRGESWIDLAAPQAATVAWIADAAGTRTPRPDAPVVPITWSPEAPGWVVVTEIGGSGVPLPYAQVLSALPMSRWLVPEVGAWAGDLQEAYGRLLDAGCTPDLLPDLDPPIGAAIGRLLGEPRPEPRAWAIEVAAHTN